MSDEEPVRYTLDAIFNDVPIVVLWNDWPIVQRQTSGTQSNLLNPFVVEGDNVLAVEVHQSSLDSSDLGFDLTLSAEYLPTE